jgi:hypothetical protein
MRVTDEGTKQMFGDGRHSFYLEKRCNFPCVKGLEVCAKCIEKVAPYKTQGSRRFDHGKVSEPIPEYSHIFGGQWYQSRIPLWGEPSAQMVILARKYQAEARQGFIVIDPDYTKAVSSKIVSSKIESNNKELKTEEHKVDKQNKVVTMPRGRKPKNETDKPSNNEENTSDTKVKRKRPTIATTDIESIELTNQELINQELINQELEKQKPKKTRTTSKNITKDVTENTVEKKKQVPKKSIESPSSPITNPLLVDQPILFQEAVIPTIMEEDIEQVDTDGYEIEYISLREFEIDGVTYYHEGSKGKLYRKIKNGIGPYIGRYYKDTDNIDTSVPDSDDES